MPSTIVPGQERWISSAEEPASGSQVMLLYTAGSGVWVALYPDQKLRLIRPGNRRRCRLEPSPYVTYQLFPEGTAYTDELGARYAELCQRLVDAWNGGEIDLEEASFQDAVPLVAPAVVPRPGGILGAYSRFQLEDLCSTPLHLERYRAVRWKHVSMPRMVCWVL